MKVSSGNHPPSISSTQPIFDRAQRQLPRTPSSPPVKGTAPPAKPLPPEVDARWLAIRARGLPVDLHFTNGEELCRVTVIEVGRYVIMVTRDSEEYLILKTALAWLHASREELEESGSQ